MAKYEEYNSIYNNSSDDEDFEDFTECGETMDEVSERMKGTIARGDCVYCGGHNTMEY